jgi:hypothetical protein
MFHSQMPPRRGSGSLKGQDYVNVVALHPVEGAGLPAGTQKFDDALAR